MRIIRWLKEKIGGASGVEAPTLFEKMRALISELEEEFSNESDCVLASLPEENRLEESINLAIGKSEAIAAAIECLKSYGEPEFAAEIGRENFHLWTSMAVAEANQ